ncbi:MAG: DUF1549 domain-containing protein [Planctomycetota bacterium]|nr:DUF1549 domain-containing protein [Planctomycetota bacterium]MDA1247710.1 DUF1549 domain-containing protein [Planctomycetota bacterium]
MSNRIGLTLLIIGLSQVSISAAADPELKPVTERFATGDTDEIPNFRRHLVPLLGKVGCNSRACHGSFQGQGDFRLSLFGYDFKMDHEGLVDRVDTDDAAGSYAIQKAILEEPHRGGKRFEKSCWEYNLFVKWIAGGAKSIDLETTPRFERLEITPSEIRFTKDDEKIQLKVVSVWSDGSREDVTCLSRFQTNDEVIADVSKTGEVSSHQSGDTHVVVFYDNGVLPVPVIRPVSDKAGTNYPLVKTSTKVDELVLVKLSKLGVMPSDVAGDTEFLRRVSLDMVGTLPTPQEIEAFVADSSDDKRARKIDELLERPAYAAWWATRFADWTGNSDDQLNNVTPVRSMAARDWYEWLRVRLERNEPYDKIAEGFVLANSREKGESYREFCEKMAPLYASKENANGTYADRSTMPHYWARNNFRTPEDRAIGFAYNFLGIRIQCAQCHKHPFDQWTMDDFHQFKNFFVNTRFRGSPESREGAKEILKELGVDDSLRGNDLRRQLQSQIAEGKVTPFEEVWTNVPQPPRNDGKGRPVRQRNGAGAGAREAKLLGEAEATDLSKFEDPRQPLMDWLREDKKQLFAKSVVNRIWSCYFNVGIVEPPDDLSLANPPSNSDLLDYLTTGFVASGYDLKWVHREITSSDTYQRTWATNETNLLDDRNFSHSIPRRMPAEVAMDALVAATSSDDAFAELHTDVLDRNIAQISAGSRYNENPQNYALSVFGRSIRESNCDCDRSQEPSLLQTVFLQNDSYIYDLIDRGKGGWINQVSSDLGLKQSRVSSPGRGAGGNTTARQIASLNAQIKRAKADLKKAEKDKDEKAAAQLKRRIEFGSKRLDALKGSGSKDDEGSGLAQKAEPEKIEKAIRSTYLRTLSRQPKVDELEKAVAYVNASEDQLNGVRDVLWALINTKEFIVNH